MNASAAQVVVDSFAKSGFGTLEAMLGFPFTVESATPADMPEDELVSKATTYGVWIRAKIVGGGSVAVALQAEDVSKLLGLVAGEEGKTELDDSDAGMLGEVGDAFLGSGIAALSDFFGDSEDAELEAVESMWGQEGSGLAEFIGQPATGAEVSYSADPHFDTKVFVVYSQAFEERVAAHMDGETADEALVSDDEMKDILSGFTPEDETEHAAEPPGPTGEIPENLAVIMDIELVATARLGKIEMPLSDVLSFSPGSIIEVGHLIDEPVELLVNDKLIARGDVVVVDEKFGLRITEIISPQERIESLS